MNISADAVKEMVYKIFYIGCSHSISTGIKEFCMPTKALYIWHLQTNNNRDCMEKPTVKL
jgi:hypothetical protein